MSEKSEFPSESHNRPSDDRKGFAIERFAFLSEEDFPFIEELTAGVRRVLTRQSVTPQQICGLGKLLHGLQRLPRATPGVDIEVTVGNTTPDNTSYQSITLSDCIFELASGGSDYTPNVGGDSYTSFSFLVEIGGFRNKTDAVEVYDWVCSFVESLCDNDQDLKVHDLDEGSVLDWDEKTPEGDWDQLG